eukprot:TRINITY_DN5782_c0_g2_i2.p1 TRINITY_DN5782_c0_g2~~TRINITY_DN5782_c0_g2_i2.p1  ORF type:complete len:507 (-),score=28.15 TRINITY_DN5782_c0_g2_i2:372-1805(-)
MYSAVLQRHNPFSELPHQNNKQLFQNLQATRHHYCTSFVLHHSNKIRGITKRSAAKEIAFPNEAAYQANEQYYVEQDSSAVSSAGGTSTFVQAVVNVLNILMGVGLLSISFGLSQSGWVGLPLLWLLAFVTNYTGKALVECHAEVSKSYQKGTKVGYEEIAEKSFGLTGRRIISNVMYIELLGTCALLLILEGDNLAQLLGSTLGRFISQTNFVFLAALIVLPTLFMRDVSALSYLGFCGFTATVAVVSCVAYALFSGNYVAGAETVFANWAAVPLLFGIFAFVFAGHGVFPSIQGAMKQPNKFPKVLDVAYLIVTSLCTFIGVAGYYMYGKGVADVVIFNLPQGFLRKVCSCMILINPVAKFALTLEPVAQALKKQSKGQDDGFASTLLCRFLLGFLCLTAARYVPFLAYFMALVGSFLTMGVSVIFPVLCHQQLFGNRLNQGKQLWNKFVAVLGVGCAVSGTAAALIKLMEKAVI